MTARISTPSGRPEVVVFDKSRPQLIAQIAKWSRDRGFQIADYTDSSITTFTEGTTLVDGWDTRYQPIKEAYVVPTTNIYTLRHVGNQATIYLNQFQTQKRASSGVYTGDPVLVTQERNSREDLERLQRELEQLAVFIAGK